MADIDDLIEEALAEKESRTGSDLTNSNLAASSDSVSTADREGGETKKVEGEKPNNLIYRRVKKGEKAVDPVKDAVQAAVEDVSSIASAREQETSEEPVEERKETTEELRAKLRSKRQDLIQKRTTKREKALHGALTPIYYCDTDGCKNVTKSSGKCCPTCKCFYYCSVECQTADWKKNHKDMCGKNPTAEGKAKLEVYIKARDAAQALYEHTKGGNYITVMNEKADLGMPACMFASVAEKSNVLFWKTYIQNSIFTTAKPDTIGTLSYKLQAAMDAYPDKKVYLISVLLDRIRDEKTTECVLRLFISDEYGGTMASPANGKIIKQVTRYTRRAK